MERGELLARIRERKADLDDALAAIPPDRMETPGEGGVWSPKDQLSHLAAWHEILLARMGGRLEEDVLELPPGRYADMEIDEVNRFLIDRDRRRGLPEARDAFERTFAEIVATLEGLPDEAFGRPYRPELHDRVLIDTIAGNTFEHYEEHLPMLRSAAGR